MSKPDLVGRFFVNLKNNRAYKILASTQMKLKDSEWVDAVIYQCVGDEKVYTRDEESFIKKFEGLRSHPDIYKERAKCIFGVLEPTHEQRTEAKMKFFREYAFGGFRPQYLQKYSPPPELKLSEDDSERLSLRKYFTDIKIPIPNHVIVHGDFLDDVSFSDSPFDGCLVENGEQPKYVTGVDEGKEWTCRTTAIVHDDGKIEVVDIDHKKTEEKYNGHKD